ncbi:FG-GAP repeat protein [Methylococcus sp. ANG]|uniref:FG-GAP repeat protein n=1 Tax=Methylococcus sp. ANG TaxID=3231903 RepID=UPI0034598535
MNTRTALQSRHFAWLFIAAAGIEALSLPACAAARLEPPADLRTAINETLRRIEPAPNGHYIAHNPEQRLAVGFDGQGIRLAPSTKGSSWHWGLKLQGYGVPGRIAPVRRAQTVNHGPRLEYRRDGITEWYENRPEGLEQGFTLAHPPKAGVREVELRLSANGDLSLKLDTDGHGATLVDSAGKETLAYRKLDVVDARGKHLPAKLTLAGNALAIRVDVHGAAWPVVVDPLIYDIGQKLRAQTMFGGDDAQKDAGFGRAIALSADGRTALVGAPFAEVSGLPYAGTAYVYTLDAAGWTIEWKLVPQDTEGFGEFGTSVALSADGNTALIGAYGMTAAGQAEAGAAYLYTRTGGGWLFQQKLTAQTSGGADDAVKLGHFGMAVALTGDGNTAAVGALDANAGMVDYAGAVYLYGCTTDISDPWRKHCQVSQKIIAQKTDGTDDAESGAAFGDAVALSQDGGALLVGPISPTLKPARPMSTSPGATAGASGRNSRRRPAAARTTPKRAPVSAPRWL